MKRVAGLLAIDVDGTLITDHGSITDKVSNALEKAVSLNWEVVIASGRTYHAAKPIIEKLPFIRYAVMSNGACIMDVQNFEVVHIEKLPSSLVETVICVMREHGAIPVSYDSNVEDQQVYYDTLEGACKYFEWFIREDPRCVKVKDVMNYTGDIMQINMLDSKDIIFSVKEALTEIEATVITLPFESVHFGGKNHDYWFMQIVGKGAKKNIALKRVAELLRIPEGRLIAVGDNYNDTDMIKDADIGVAMENAPEEVKKLAKVIVASNNHSGLAQVVNEVILSGKYFS